MASTGSSIFGSSVSANNFSQGSLFGTSSGSTVSTQMSPAETGVAAVTQSMPIPFGSSRSSPSVGTSGITSFTSSSSVFGSSTSSSSLFGSSTPSKVFGSSTSFGVSSSTSPARFRLLLRTPSSKIEYCGGSLLSHGGQLRRLHPPSFMARKPINGGSASPSSVFLAPTHDLGLLSDLPATVAAWLVSGHWILNNLLGISLCITFVSHVRLPNIKICAMLLGCLVLVQFCFLGSAHGSSMEGNSKFGLSLDMDDSNQLEINFKEEAQI